MATALSTPGRSTGGIPAHVTVLFPFVPAAQRRRRSLASAAARSTRRSTPFAYELARVETFPGYAWLAPEPAAPFLELIAATEPPFPLPAVRRPDPRAGAALHGRRGSDEDDDRGLAAMLAELRAGLGPTPADRVPRRGRDAARRAGGRHVGPRRGVPVQGAGVSHFRRVSVRARGDDAEPLRARAARARPRRARGAAARRRRRRALGVRPHRRGRAAARRAPGRRGRGRPRRLGGRLARVPPPGRGGRALDRPAVGDAARGGAARS